MGGISNFKFKIFECSDEKDIEGLEVKCKKAEDAD
jgi:hypothetical protein